MIFFKENYKPYIVNPYTTKKDVQRWCDKYNVVINISSDDSTFWAGFSNMYGLINGLTPIEARSFSYMVSMFMTGIGVNCGTDIYFREDSIEYDILGIFDNLKKNISDEEELAKQLFFKIFDLYENDIEKYSFKTQSLVFRLSQSDYDKFMDVDGESKVDKLRNLLKDYSKKKPEVYKYDI